MQQRYLQKDIDEVMTYLASQGYKITNAPTNKPIVSRSNTTSKINKKIVLTVIICVLAIALIYLIITSGLFDKKQVNNNNIVVTTNIPQNTTASTQQIANPVFSKSSFAASMDLIRNETVSDDTLDSKECNKFTSQEQKDVCLSIVADLSQKSIYCTRVQTQKYADNCYLTLVYNGDTNVCEKIVETSLKEFCMQVRIVKQMNAYYRNNETDKVVELNKAFKPNIYNSNPVVIDYTNVYAQNSTYH
jgi:hypothetical protein